MTLKTWKASFILASICGALHLVTCDDYFIVQNRNEGSCMTPEAQDGNCLLINKCNYILEIIKKKGIVHQKTLEFIRKSTCGFEGRNPKVCCPKDDANDRNSFNEKNDKRQESSGEKSDDPNESFQNPLQLLPGKCGEDLTNRIIGGEVTELDEFPWMAVLEYEDAKSKITACGGALITKRYVLTAAHCIRAVPSTWRLRNVRLGEHDMRTDPDCIAEGNGEMTCADPVLVIPIEREIVHEGYMSPERFRNDIALLRLDRDVETTRYVQPICLPTSGDVSKLYWSAGWGQMERKFSSKIKLKVSLPHVHSHTCRQTYLTKNIVLDESQMCAGGLAGKDTCKGDSGGPLMKQVREIGKANKWVIDAVVSIGHSPCGLRAWPAVYTKVHNYLSWILSKLKP